MSEQEQLQIKSDDEDIKGAYSNLIQVSHTKEEFVLDFFLIFPPQGILVSRVVMCPGHVKRMIKTLKENMKKYEKDVGEIKEIKDLKKDKKTKIGF